MASDRSSSAGVQASCSSSSGVSCFIRCPDWLEMVTPTPPGAITFPTSSRRTAVPYKSTFKMASTEAWLGDTPAALTSMVISPCFCASAIIDRTEGLDDRSISTGRASKPAPFMVSAAIRAFSAFLSPTIIFFPYPMRRAMAIPICPAPAKIITSFFIAGFLSSNLL